MIIKLQDFMKKVTFSEIENDISQSQAGRIRIWLTSLQSAEQINWWLEEDIYAIDESEIYNRIDQWLHRELEEAKIKYDLQKEIANGI